MAQYIWDFNAPSGSNLKTFDQWSLEQAEKNKLTANAIPSPGAKTYSTTNLDLYDPETTPGYLADRIAPRIMPDNNLLKGIGGAVDKIENSKLWRTVIGNPDEGFGVGDMTNALLMANPTATAGAGIATLGKAAKATPAAAKAGEAINKGVGLLKGIVAKTPTPIKAGIGAGAAVTGAETIAGAVDPDYVNPISGQRTFPSKFGSSLRAGTGDTVGLVGSVAEWQGYDELGKSLKNKGKKISEGFEPNRTEFKGWQSFLDPEWYANNVAATLPTTASLIPLMIAGYMGGGKIGTKALASKAGQKMVAKKFGQEMVEKGTAQITPFVKNIFGSLGGTALSRPLESAMEAGGTYEDALARGMNEDQARTAANRVFTDNLKLAGMDVAQLALTFAPTGKIASKMGKALTATGKVVGDVATESLEEGLQQGIQQRATGADTRGLIAQMWNPTTEMKESMAIGGLLGGGMGAVGAVRDMVTTIKQRTIAELPDDVMPTIQQRLQQITDMGVDPVKAIDQVLDEVSDSPGVKATVERITQEEAASTIEKLSSSVSGQEPGKAAPINEGTQPAAPIDSNEGAIDVVYTSDGTPLQIIDQSSPAVYVVQDQGGKRSVVSRDDVSEPAQIPQKDFAAPKADKPENNTVQNQTENGGNKPSKPVNPPKDQNGLGGQPGTNAANVPENGASEPVDADSNVENGIEDDIKSPKPAKEPWQMTRDEYSRAQLEQDAEESQMIDYIEKRTNEGASIADIAKELKVNSSKVTDLYNSLVNDEVADIDEQAGPEEQHKSEVERAIMEGKPVPEEVLKDYPNLIKTKPETSKPEPEKKPTPDRKLKIQRGKHGAVDVVFPDSVHADLFSFNGRLQRQIKGEKNYFDVAREIKRLALSLGLPEGALNKGDIPGQYKAAVMKLISGLPAGASYEAPRLSDLPDIVTEKEPEKDPDTPPKQPVDMDALKAYAEGVVKSGEVEAVYLIGSTAAKGTGNDIDILYQLKDQELPKGEDDASKEIEAIVESLDMELDLYDTFIQVGERYFHLSSGAGRGFVENNDYANENKDKPKVLLARAEKTESPNQHAEETPEEPAKEPTVKEVGKFTITKTKHTKTGADMWVVRLKDDKQLPTDEFKKLASRIKALGGSRWSKFSKGFNFYEDPTEKLQPKAEVKKGDKVYDKDGNELTVTNPGNENTMRVQDQDGNQHIIKKDEVKGKKPEAQEWHDTYKDYGRAGKAQFRKIATKAGLTDPENSDYRDLVYFFEKYYNAGLNGKFMPHVDFHPDDARTAYDAGKKDAENKANLQNLTSGRDGKIENPVAETADYTMPSELAPPKSAPAQDYANRAAHTTLKLELNKFSKKLAERLGYEPDTNRKGKAEYASVNHMDASIILWKPNTDYGIYIHLNYAEVANGAEYNYNSSLKMEPRILYRVTTKKDKYNGLFNNFFTPANGELSVSELASLIESLVDRQIAFDERKGVVEPKPAEPIKNKDRSPEWVQKMKADAEARIKANKGRLLSGLPMDDMLDYSIIGMCKIIEKGLDLAAFTKEMIDEYGPQLKNWMAGIYSQSQAMLEMTEEDLNQMIEDARRDSTSNNEAEGVNLNQENAEAKEGEQDAKPDKSVLEPRDEEGTADGRLPSGTNVDSLLGTGGQDTGLSGQNVGPVAGQAPVQQGQSGGSDTSANIPTTDQTSPDGQEPAGTSDGADDSQVGQPGGDGKSVEGDTTGSTTIPGEPEGSTDKAEAEGDQVIDDPLQTLKDAFGNFHINEENPVFVKGGKKARFRANIAALKTLDLVLSEKREATQEEKRKLALFSGWGALMEAFTFEMELGRRVPKYPAWKQEYAEVKDLLNELESKHFGSEYNYRGGLYENAAGSVMNAHYTSPAVIGGMYQALEQMGFKKGNVLEPSMGTGNFFGMLPLNFAARSKLFGVELDPVTGKIAQLLYPNADIRIQGFQDAVYPKNFFDVAVGNVPFGTYGISDRAYPSFVTERIHNYFFAKTIDKVRPGGVVAFITSSGTLDAEGNERVRQYLAQKANLLGAIRLPGDAFRENAGTEVTTDIIFLQKLKDGELPGDIQWTGTVKKEIDEETYSLNQYYNDHPDMVLGEFVKDKLTGGRLGVKSTSQDIEEAIAQAIEKLPKNVISNRGAKQTPEMTPENALLAAEMLDGGITLKDSKLYRKIGDSLVQITENVAQIKQLVQIRELAKEVLAMQRDPEVAESDLEAKRAEMKKLYDAYVKKHDNFLKTDIRNGRLWGRPHIEKILGYAREIGSKDKKGKVKTEFTLEPETYLLKSLEIEIQAVDDEGNIKQEFKPSQIMTQRTYKVVIPVDKVDNAQDGLVASLNQFGYVDMDHIVEIYGKSEEEIAAELGDKIYKNPLSGWETADEYLSGNVKKKLREAQERADYEPEYSRNVEALSKVIPKDVPFTDITVNLGDGWVPFHITEAAVKNLLGFTGYRSDSSINLEYSPLDNKWNLSKGTGYRNTAEMAGITAGVPKDPLAIVKIALNNTETIIKTAVDGKTYVNQEATNALKAKVKEIRQYLKEYLSADLDAMNEVEEIYNDKFNTTVPRDYAKIAEYFSFPNMNPDVELRPHQKNAIVRALMGGNSLLAHGVGAGKTFEQIGIAMEAKRLGLANKPLLVVPNTKLTDFESDAKLLYPGAKVLALSQDDFEGNSIKRTLALAAVNDWDMVIVRHSSFSKIPVSPETELPALQAEIQELEAMLEEMTGERGFTVKKLQARLEKLRAKLHDYRENRVQYEGLLNFEDMGFDMLIVDEAHEYKNYPLTGKASSIKGLASGDSDKARDMMIKSGYIRKLNGGNRGVVFGTGTPISNSMAEVFVMFKYLRPDLLQEAGISHFDAWADAFSNITEVAEVSAKGEFRNKMQFKSFVNLPELITLFREFTDIKMQDTLNLPLPKHEIVKVECEAHPQLAEVMARVEAQWADAIKSRQLFRLINIVLNAPQDIRLVIAGAINHSGSKVNKIANNVKEVYDKTAKEKGTQLIFATTGESSLTGFSLWTELETQLIKKGIPANEIAFIKTGTKEEELEEIYRKINAGKIRVAIGSFSKMGVGINVQERLFAIHELNAPYRPADIEQAEGRMIRQGNTYYDTGEKVRVYRYVTVGEEGAFSGDAFKWQILENKVKSINAVMKGDPSVRVLDAFDEDSYDAATMKAIAIGDERYIRKVELEGEIDVLRSAYNAYQTGLARAQRELTESRKKIRTNRDNIHNLQRALKTIEEMPQSVIEKQIVTIGGEKYTLTDKDSKKAADEAVKRHIAEYEAKPKKDSGRKQVANVQGMILMYDQKYNNGFGSMIQGFALFANYYTNLMKVESRYIKLDKNNSSKDFLSLDKDNIFDAVFRKIRSFQREIDKALKENDVLDKEVEKYEQILKQPFKHQEELDEKRAELREIDAALNIGTVAASGEGGSMDGEEGPAANARQRKSGPRLKESTQTNEGAEAPIFYDPNEMLDELSDKLGRKMYAAPEAMEREDMQAAGIIANLLTQSQLIPMKGQDAPQGAAYGNNVFVSVETEDPHLYVAMHEIEHTLEDVDPEAHDEFMAIAKKYFNGASGMSDYYFRHGYSYKDIWKEFTADVTAEIMQQPGFWAKVREQSPALIKKIVDIIDQIITKFRKEVAKDSSMLQYISDIEAFRDEVAGATAKLLKKKPRNLLDLRGAEAFAAKMKQGSSNNVGYHAGDLGKSEHLGRQMGSSRGTGHFGTGTYFVGNPEKLGYDTYQKRPQHKVGFDGYNLYRPDNFEQGLKLHDALRFLNRDYLSAQRKAMSEREIDNLRYGDPEDMIAVMKKYGYWDEEQFREWHGMTSDHFIKNEVEDRTIWDGIKRRADATRRSNEQVERAHSYQREFEFDAIILFGITPARAKALAAEVYQEIDKDLGGKRTMMSPEADKSDSASTRFMKKLGYEGVDVRHIPRMDNVEYGSVIYDLKDSANKKAGTNVLANIGTESTTPKTKTGVAPIFYSQLERVIQAKMPNAASPDQVLAIIKGGQVKQEEIEWSGIQEWLQGQGAKVKKDDALAYLKSNDIQIEEVANNGKQGQYGYFLDGDNEAWSAAQVIEGANELRIETEDPAAEITNIDDAIAFYSLYGSEVTPAGPKGTKYRTYTLPGGENYTELLLTMPDNSGYKVVGNGEGAFNIRKPDGTLVPGQGNPDIPAVWNTREMAEKAGLRFYDKSSYRSGHWDEPNVLAHVRYDTRKGVDGEKILFIEEIQSDWHQAGRKQGYRTKDSMLAEKLIATKDEGYWEVNTESGIFVSNVYFSYAATEEAAIAEARRRLREEPGRTGFSLPVPDAPFKKSWHELALKRMIRYAAENGFDRVAWTTGRQQADRYDLSKQVKYIGWQKHSNGKYHVTVKDLDLNLVYNEREKTINEIEELAGKEIAQKIQSSTENSGVIEGDSLKIGGSGMRGFYDRMIPSFLNKYVKKWGAKVEPLGYSDLSRQVPFDFAVIEGNPSIPITDAMRKTVLREGQPRFKQAKSNLLAGIGIGSQVSFKHSKGSGFNLPNKHQEVQDRMEGARGVPAETLRERMKEIWDEVVRKTTREFEHLPHGGTYAELRNSLLLLRKQKGIAADKTLKVLNDITKPLNEYEYDVFSYKVIFDDLAHEFEENHLLPFGLTEENFEDIKDYIDEEAAKLPKVQEAIEKRRGAWNKAKNDYIRAQKAVGFNVEDRLKKEDYFRHQVLEYANGKGVMGSGKRLRVQTGRGFLRKRGGSTYDINTDYLQAEFEVMAQMIVDTASAGTVKVVKENHDIVKELKREAVRINDQGMLQEFQRLLDIMQDTETTPEQLYRRTLNRKQAIAYSQLYKLAAMGELPNGGGKWDQIIEVMSNAYWDAKEANANDEEGEGGTYSARIPDEYQGQLMAYLNYLASQDESEVGKIKARTVFKGMAQKVKTIQKTLGTRYVTWEDLIPDGYTAWQPREGHMFFMADSIPQNMAEQLLYGIADEISIDATMLKKVMVAGQKYPEMVIPDEVALTLETLYKDANQIGPVAKWLFHTPYRAWKQWQLISPRRYFKYNVRNTTGDLDAVLAGNPSALRPKILKKAWDDLKQGFFSKDREYTRNLQGWFERGGFETLMQAQEINDINRNRQFQHLMESRMQKDLWEKAQASPKTLWNGYWDTVRATTDFREALMRYACYLDYLEQMQTNHGIPKNFGASNREEIMALPDIRDRAAKLSNELLGAYDEVSVVGTWLADHLFPFWRWNEVNFTRYMRLGRNAWQDGQLCATTARKFTGLAIRSPLIAAKIGKFVLQATALTVMLNLWNMLFFGDEDKELPEDVRNRLHITFGRDSNGNILYFSRLGALQDFLDWFGLDTPVKTAQDFLSGRKSLLEIATDWGKADVNKVLNAITPFVKTPVELITDRKFYPDVFEAMPIRDRWQYLFDSFGLGNEYKAMAGKPTRGYGNSLYDLFYYRSDPHETAYYKNKENVIKFRKKLGTYNEGYSESIRSDALYNIKLAMRYGDREAVEKYLLDYINKGGTAKGLTASLKSLSPVYGLNETQTEVYIQNYLDVEGKENLAKAIDYHQRVIGGEMFEQD